MRRSHHNAVSLSPFLLLAMDFLSRPATIDWCEANFVYSSVVAEVANTYSNVLGVALAIYGCHFSLSQNLPFRYFVCFTVRCCLASWGSPCGAIRPHPLNVARTRSSSPSSASAQWRSTPASNMPCNFWMRSP